MPSHQMFRRSLSFGWSRERISQSLRGHEGGDKGPGAKTIVHVYCFFFVKMHMLSVGAHDVNDVFRKYACFLINNAYKMQTSSTGVFKIEVHCFNKFVLS